MAVEERPAFRRGDEITVVLDGLSGDRTAVGRAGGVVCFVEDAVPGDTVVARVTRSRRQFVEARALSVVEPSPLRVEAPCRHFRECGGCLWQNLSYDAQLRFKRRRVADAFSRIGGMPDVEVLEPLGCPEPYRYRNKMEYTFSNDRWRTGEEMAALSAGPGSAGSGPEASGGTDGPALGLHPAGRFDKVLDLRECLLQSSLGERIMLATGGYFRSRAVDAYSTRTHRGYLRHLVVREGTRTGETMVNLVTTDDRPGEMQAYTEWLLGAFPGITTVVNNVTDRRSMVARGDSERVYHGSGTIRERIGRFTYRISANSFFQTNTTQAEALFGEMAAMAGFRRGDVVYDLYCGTGAIALYISSRVASVVGIESVESAVADAVRNAEENGVSNCRFIRADLPEGLGREALAARGLPPATAVVVDPPRSGLTEKVIAGIVALGPERVVYVSCNAATQARDAARFAEAGYRPGPVRPVDMFPHTDHIETVTVLARSGPAS